MKCNPIMAALAVCLAALLGYLAYDVADPDKNAVACGVLSAVCFAGTLVPMMSMSFESDRLATNIKVMTGLFIIIFLISHFSFASFGVKMPLYVIVNGLALIIYIAVLYKMQGIKDV